MGEDTFNCFADDHPHTEDELVWRNCAIWQNAACFTSDNIHSEEEFGLITEVHRGCSSFELPNTSCAHMDYDEGTSSNFTIFDVKNYIKFIENLRAKA